MKTPDKVTRRWGHNLSSVLTGDQFPWASFVEEQYARDSEPTRNVTITSSYSATTAVTISAEDLQNLVDFALGLGWLNE